MLRVLGGAVGLLLVELGAWVGLWLWLIFVDPLGDGP
jgi:hypothetical protein